MPDSKPRNGLRSSATGGGTALADAPTAPSTRFGGGTVAPPSTANAPTLRPPMKASTNAASTAASATRAASGSASAVQGAATVWVNNQTINALWTINEDRNSWVGVAGVGWTKLANNSDTAIVALTILSGNAKDGQRPVNFRQEDDGMIHEMYVW